MRTTSGDDVDAPQAPPGVVPAVPPTTMPGDRRDGIEESRPGRAASVPMRLPWMRVPVEPATITETPAPPLPEMTPPAESRATDDIVGRAFDADAVTAVCDL